MPPFNDRRVARTKMVHPRDVREGDIIRHPERGFEPVRFTMAEYDTGLGAPPSHGTIFAADSNDPEHLLGARRDPEIDPEPNVFTINDRTYYGDERVERTTRTRSRKPRVPGQFR